MERLWTLVMLVVVAACSGGATRGSSTPSTSCPSAGTEAPFGKLMNPSFAASYEGCSIRTTAKFWNANSMMSANLGDPNSVVFEVSDPSVGEGSYEFVKIPKAASDPVFTFKKGDTIVLTGGTHAWSAGGAKSHYFAATSVAKASP
jgi:hypothetical protein